MWRKAGARCREVTMPNDITGSYHAIPIRPARAWARIPHPVPRNVQIVAQFWGLTRGAKPPPGVAWKRALVALLCKLLAMMLIAVSVVP